MSFQVEWGPKASKNLAKLPKDTIKRIFDKMNEVKEDPFRFLEHFEGQNFYKLRIGDYRALIDIERVSMKSSISLVAPFGIAIVFLTSGK